MIYFSCIYIILYKKYWKTLVEIRNSEAKYNITSEFYNYNEYIVGKNKPNLF